MLDLPTLRRCYAEELRYTAPVRDCEAVVTAFAAVPRERFLGPGPWRLIVPQRGSYPTPDADPRHLYHNVLVVIDEARDLNNGEPRLWAYLFDKMQPAPGERVLHVGAGTGYYSAILAETVGPAGRVTAAEVDAELAERARANLSDRDNVTVVTGDGATVDAGPLDCIVVNAGVTEPAPGWLDALTPGGRMLLPLTGTQGYGAFLLVTRTEDGYDAAFVSPTGIFHCVSGRNDDAADRLTEAFRQSRGQLPAVASLRRDGAPDDTCWFAGDGFWLSLALPPEDA